MELFSDLYPTETETDFLQPFRKDLDCYQTMSVNDLQNLFSFQGKDEDLIRMLELKSDKAADYLLDKLEDFLMGISK